MDAEQFDGVYLVMFMEAEASKIDELEYLF